MAPYVAINFASYETLKQLVKTDGSETHALEGLVMGGLSGTAAVTLTYPSDVLRRRMMMQGAVVCVMCVVVPCVSCRACCVD